MDCEDQVSQLQRTENSGLVHSHFATKAIHAGQDPEQWSSKALVPPIVMSATYKKTSIQHEVWGTRLDSFCFLLCHPLHLICF